MSRGLGRKQREVVHVLRDADGSLLPCEVRTATRSDDRPNTRRALRTLEERGIALQDDEGRWTLDPRASLRLYLRESTAESEKELRDERRQRRDDRRAFMQYVEDLNQSRREYVEWYWRREEMWADEKFHGERRKKPTQAHRLILAVIEKYADPPEMGLSEVAVRTVALERIGDPSNYRRAVRSLIRNQHLQRTEDGDRLRCRPWHRWYYVMADEYRILPAGHLLCLIDEPDWDEVEAVLECYGDLPDEVA